MHLKWSSSLGGICTCGGKRLARLHPLCWGGEKSRNVKLRMLGLGQARTSQRAAGLRRELQRETNPVEISYGFGTVSFLHFWQNEDCFEMTMGTEDWSLICLKAHLGLSLTLLWGPCLSDALLCCETISLGWLNVNQSPGAAVDLE